MAATTSCLAALLLVLALAPTEAGEGPSWVGNNDEELHDIKDYWSDIEDLDVGDLDDETSDVPIDFRIEMGRRKQAIVPDQRHFQDIGAFADAQKGGQQMSVATFKWEVAEKLGKVGTEERAIMWKTMLETAGVKVQLHVTDPGKVLFVSWRMDMHDKVKDFVLSQPETDWWEYRQDKYFPEGRDGPTMDYEERKLLEMDKGWRERPYPKRPSYEPVVKKKKKRKGKKTTEAAA
uniref:Uncharacterized protein n=1 Tax=Alexandrium catenella TaxID=2925 RepID=A0A7S1WGE7_ALECA